MKHFVVFQSTTDPTMPCFLNKIYRLLVVQLEKREALKEEEEKKRKALKRRTVREQVNKILP